MYTNKLKEILIQEKPKETIGNWSKVEERLKTTLPEDFKEFISTYGTGEIANHLIIFNPFARKSIYNLMQQTEVLTLTYNYFKRKNPSEYPYNAFPEQNGLLPLGITMDGDQIFWLTSNDKDWTIVVRKQATGEFIHYEENFTEFLYKLLTKEIPVELLPKETNIFAFA